VREERQAHQEVTLYFQQLHLLVAGVAEVVVVVERQAAVVVEALVSPEEDLALYQVEQVIHRQQPLAKVIMVAAVEVYQQLMVVEEAAEQAQ
jgi:hypothetical protein